MIFQENLLLFYQDNNNMGIPKYNPIQSSPFPTFSTTESNSFITPFSINVVGQTVNINPYSSLVYKENTRQIPKIFGLGFDFDIDYGDKLFLEVYFDDVLNPLAPRIRNDRRWTDLTVSILNASNSETDVHVYPSELDIIQKKDLSARKDQITEDITSADTEYSDKINQIQQDIDDENISAEDGAKLIAYYQDISDNYQTELTSVLSKIPSYFSGNFATKKLFRSFKMIGFTTRNLSSDLGGQIIFPSDGSKEFQLVPCLDTNLFLADSATSGIPIKTFVPWTKPIYSYLIDGQEEDKKITGID